MNKKEIVVGGVEKMFDTFKKIPPLYRTLLLPVIRNMADFEVDELAKIIVETSDKLKS